MKYMLAGCNLKRKILSYNVFLLTCPSYEDRRQTLLLIKVCFCPQKRMSPPVPQIVVKGKKYIKYLEQHGIILG
jgi:hypothetical protein